MAFGAAILVFVVGAFLHPASRAPAASRRSSSWRRSSASSPPARHSCILVGGIDLSVPWVLNAAGDPVRDVVARTGRPRAASRVLLALGLGLAVGLVNGLGIAYLAVPAVVMTLAMNGIMEGLTLGRDQGPHVRVVRLLCADRVAECDPRSSRRHPCPAVPVVRRDPCRHVHAQLHDVRPPDLRDRQQRARRLTLPGSTFES